MTDSAKTGPTAIPQPRLTSGAEPSTSKDVFGQLLVIIGLYVLVISFGVLIFGLIDIYFPDVLSYDFYNRQAIRWPLATLIVVFPLYLWYNSYLQKDLERNPEKKELKVRKWLLHFTLFVAAIIIVADLIALIYRYLNGDLTTQFVLKILTVLVIALAVFTYYLWNIRRKVPAAKDPKMRWFVWLVSLAGIFFIVIGFVTAGSPIAQRLKRFDERRISDLQAIQNEIINFWQAKETLPQNLDQLRDDIRGFIPPADPETGDSYEYRVRGTLQFELCATFKTSNKQEPEKSGAKPVPLAPRELYYPYPGITEESWLHDAERTCFSRTIDPDRYPSFKNQNK